MHLDVRNFGGESFGAVRYGSTNEWPVFALDSGYACMMNAEVGIAPAIVDQSGSPSRRITES